MFLNQVHFMWRDLGRASGRRAALLLLGPFAILVALALPTSLGASPVASHAELSGTGSRTGPQIHLRDSYQMTLSITGKSGCTYAVMIGGSSIGYGFGTFSFPSGSTASRQRVSTWDLPDLPDGLYTIDATTTGCGNWAVSLDRSTGAA